MFRSTKKFLMFFFLVLALLGTLCNAQCSIKPTDEKGCFKHGRWHRVNAVWKTNNCQRCECKPKEMICCSLVFRPINYDREKCVAMFHKRSCSIRVVNKTDPAKRCEVFAGVG
ncbi:beta-microseminoprotein [Podarcis muralis]